MADVKKATVKKPVAAKKATVKAEVKTATVVKEEPKKVEVKVEAKKAPAKAAAPKKAPAKKAAPAKKTEVKSNIVLELSVDRQYTNDDLMKILKDVWKYDQKKKVSDIKTVEMYVKPYEGSVWYKVNGEVEGEFSI